MIEYTLEKQDFSSNNLPEIIVKQYDALYSMLDNKQYYGVLFKVKDVLEIALKFPEIVLIAGIEQYIMREDVEAETVINKKAFEVMEIVLSYKLSLGHCEDISEIFACCSFEDLPLNVKDKQLYQTYLDVISNISAEYTHPDKKLIENDCVSNWRNDYIGHGALNTNEEELKDVVEPLVKILNKVLSLSDYSNVEHVFSESELLIRSRKDNSIFIRIDPFVDYFDYVFDSYEWDRDRVRVLNYNKGDKKKNSVLSDRFAKLRKKVKFIQPSSNDLECDVITHQDEQSVIVAIEGKIKMITPFFEATQKLLAEEKGMLLLRAGRGMGKSTFADSISVDDIFDRRSNTGSLYNKLKQQDGPDISVWVYHFNEFWKSDRNTFKNALNFTHKFVKHENLQNAYDNLPRGFKCEDGQKDEFRKSFAAYLEVLLKVVREVKRKCKLLLILDGIDEIPLGENKVNVSEFLDRDMLPEGVYILLLGRTEEEWILPDDIKNMYLKETVIKRSGSYNTCLIEYANSILNSVIKKVTDKDKTAVKKITSQQMVEKADCRMLYLNIINSISKLNSVAFVNIFNTDQKGELLNSYLSAFDTVSIAYKNQLLRVLLILSLSRFGLTMSELYFLYEGSLMAKPNFKFLGILNDLRGFIKSERSSKGNLFSLANEGLYEECSQKTFERGRKSILNEFEEILSYDVSGKPLEMREILMTVIFSENEQLTVKFAEKAVDGMYAELANVKSLDSITKEEYCKLLEKICNDFRMEDELFIKAQYLLSEFSSNFDFQRYELENLFLRFHAHPELIKRLYNELFKLMVAYSENGCYCDGPNAHYTHRHIAYIYYCLLKENLADDNFDIGKNIYLPMYKNIKEYDVKDFYFLKDLYFFDSFAEFLSGDNLIRFYIYRAMMAEYFCFKPEISTTMEMVQSNKDNDIFDDYQFERDIEKALALLIDQPVFSREELYSLLLQAVDNRMDFACQKFNVTSYVEVLSFAEDLCKKIYYSNSTECNIEAAETMFIVLKNGFVQCLNQKDIVGSEKFIAKMKDFLATEEKRLGTNRDSLYRILIGVHYELLLHNDDKNGIAKLLDDYIKLLNNNLFLDDKPISDKNGYLLPSLCLERIKIHIEGNKLDGKEFYSYLSILENCLASINAIPSEKDAKNMNDEYQTIFNLLAKKGSYENRLEMLWNKILPSMDGLIEYLIKNSEERITEASLLYFAQAYISKAKIFEYLRDFNKSYRNYNYALELFRRTIAKDDVLYTNVVRELYEYYDKMHMREEKEELSEAYDMYCNQSEYDVYERYGNDLDDYYAYLYDSGYTHSAREEQEEFESRMHQEHALKESAFDTKSLEFDSSEEIWLGINLYIIFKSLDNINITMFLSNQLQVNFVEDVGQDEYEFIFLHHGKLTRALLGEMYSEQKDFERAESELNKSLAYYSKYSQDNIPFYYAITLNARRKLYAANNMVDASKKDDEKLNKILCKLGIKCRGKETIRQDIIKAMLEKEEKDLKEFSNLLEEEVTKKFKVIKYLKR